MKSSVANGWLSIGQNGTGKTTILKILNEKVDADAGSFTLGTNVKIGYYDQEQQVLHMEKTLMEEIADDYPKLTQTTDSKYSCCIFIYRGRCV